MRLLMIGAPGAGKGTQAAQIADHFHVTHISSGDLFRDHVARNTSIGRAAQSYLQAGDLVPDAIVMDMLYKPVTTASKAGGYVLDGFPRTVTQAEAAYDVAKDLGVSVQVAVELEVPIDDLLPRLLARGEDSGRPDDTEEVIRHRLEVYAEKTTPLLEYYRQRERLIVVNGARRPDEVTWSVVVQLQRLQKTLFG